MFFQKIFAYIKKSFLIESSYRLSFWGDIFGTIASLLTFYFIDRLFGRQMSPHLLPFGINYFSYVLVGIAFSSFIGTGLGSLSGQIRHEQITGTLESLLLAPTRMGVLIIAISLWNFLWASVDLLLYLLLGIFAFKIDFSNINLLSTFIIFLLSVVAFNSLGLISASFILIFKRGDPVSWVINTAFGLFGGVYFPITIFPLWLQKLSALLPITYSIRSIQMAIYKGATLRMLFPDLIVLLCLTIALIPLSLLSLGYAFRRTKEEGSLVQY